MKPKTKWQFAIGTTSRVPNSGGGLHYLIADFDDKFAFDAGQFCSRLVMQKTPHGWHMYTNRIMTMDLLVPTLQFIGADEAWIKIGQSRGYFFLADKAKVDLSWPVERMVLWFEKTTQDSGTSGLYLPEKGNP